MSNLAIIQLKSDKNCGKIINLKGWQGLVGDYKLFADGQKHALFVANQSDWQNYWQMYGTDNGEIIEVIEAQSEIYPIAIEKKTLATAQKSCCGTKELITSTSLKIYWKIQQILQ